MDLDLDSTVASRKVKTDTMPGKGTSHSIFTVGQMQEKYGIKVTKLYFAFVHLKKASNSNIVPKKSLHCRWAAQRKAVVAEWLANAVIVTDDGAQNNRKR